MQGISSISLLILLGPGTSQLEWIYLNGLVALINVESISGYCLLLNAFQLGQVSLDREEILNKIPTVDGSNAKIKKKVKVVKQKI